MRINTSVFIFAALFAAVAPGQPTADQTVDRVFHLTNVATPQDVQEVATVVRVIAEIPELSPNATQKTLDVRGTRDQVALAEWVVSEMDHISSGLSPAPHEFRPSGAGNDVVRIFYVRNMETARGFQQAATVVRSIAEIRRLVTYNAGNAAAVRGTREQIELAAWLFHELDRPATPAPSRADQYKLPGSGDIVRIFYLRHVQTERDFQQFAIQIRTASQIPHVFTYDRPRALAVRGTATEVALATRLVDDGDR